MTLDSTDTVFSKIARREIPAEIVFENERFLVIKDIAPQAPVHLLVFPKTARYKNIVELASGDPALHAELIAIAHNVALEHANGDFRLVFNTGVGAGQTVFHVHAHVLSGDLAEQSLA